MLAFAPDNATTCKARLPYVTTSTRQRAMSMMRNVKHRSVQHTVTSGWCTYQRQTSLSASTNNKRSVNSSAVTLENRQSQYALDPCTSIVRLLHRSNTPRRVRSLESRITQETHDSTTNTSSRIDRSYCSHFVLHIVS